MGVKNHQHLFERIASDPILVILRFALPPGSHSLVLHKLLKLGFLSSSGLVNIPNLRYFISQVYIKNNTYKKIPLARQLSRRASTHDNEDDSKEKKTLIHRLLRFKVVDRLLCREDARVT